MRSYKVLRAVGLAMSLLLPAFASGCNTGDTPSGETISTGTLSLPLVTTAASGTQYRLSEASFTLFGQTEATTLTLDGDPNATVFTTVLPSGFYQILLTSFVLERNNDGVFEQVDAFPLNGSFDGIEILNGTTTSYTIRFQVDASVVVMGEGTLNIDVEVSEFIGNCTPFGSDCFFFNTWCAPPELTGSVSECRNGGFVPVGGACRDPRECEVNSSCFDLGDGPVCVEVCPGANFGLECASGGICELQGESFGLCR